MHFKELFFFIICSLHYHNFSIYVAFKNSSENKSLCLLRPFPAHRISSLSQI